MQVTRVIRGVVVGGLVVVVAVIIAAILGSLPGGVDRFRMLADGTRFELRQTSFTNVFAYRHDSRRWYHRLLEPVIPASMRPLWWPAGSGSISTGRSDMTNLHLVTVRTGASALAGSSLEVGRVVAFDEWGNTFDACWGAGTFGLGSETAQLWRLSAFPRRGPRVGLRFISLQSDASWTNAAEYWIPNPAAGAFPQWEPESLPAARMLPEVEVELRSFRSGQALFEQRWRPNAPEETRCEFGFQRGGQPVAGWTVHRLTVSDATGNRWVADIETHSRDNPPGVVDFLGALWPGEAAWRLDVDVVRTNGFGEAEIWKAPPVRLSSPGEVQSLDSGWERSGVELHLVALAGPQAEHAMPYRWIGKYWGEDAKDRVVSMAIRMVARQGRWRPVVVRAEDESGRPVELVGHASREEEHQALFLKPEEGAREVRIEWSLQPIQSVRFVARPEFVERGAGGADAGPIR